jgi:Ribosomal protein L11 methyltransferase (PrmA)
MWQERFAPLRLGRQFLIVPLWQRRPRSGPSTTYNPPGEAFGTGHHPSNAGTLSAIEAILAMVVTDREAITNFEPLKSFRLRRDKFHAHFDKRYFLDRSKIAEDAPLKWSDLDHAMELLKDTLNKYSAAYDSEVFT